MFAVVVTFSILPDAMDDFMLLILENAQISLRTEHGCHQFDVATDPSRPQEVFLYELYTDPSAFQSHLASEHFLRFDAATTKMIADKTVKTYARVMQ